MPLYNIFKPNNKVPKEIYHSRLATCYTCPLFKHNTGRCGVCGCVMKLKAKLANEHCPEHKWNVYNSTENEGK